jgi:carbamoyl-phosphate synthase large subunit
MDLVRQYLPETLIIAGDSNAECLTRSTAHSFWHMPLTNIENLEILAGGMKERGVRLVIPTRDAELDFYSSHQSYFESHGIKIAVSSRETLNTCLDKLLFHDSLKSRFPVIATSNQIDIELLGPGPYVVKERYGSGSISSRLNLTSKDALEYSQTLVHPIFQPFISGSEYSIDTYTTLRGDVVGAIARRRDVIEFGESRVTTSVHDLRIESLGIEISSFLKLTGHGLIQIIDDGISLHVIECNARIGGASTLAFHCGLISPIWSILEAQGLSRNEYPFNPNRNRVKMIRDQRDSFIDLGA